MLENLQSSFSRPKWMNMIPTREMIRLLSFGNVMKQRTPFWNILLLPIKLSLKYLMRYMLLQYINNMFTNNRWNIRTRESNRMLFKQRVPIVTSKSRIDFIIELRKQIILHLWWKFIEVTVFCSEVFNVYIFVVILDTFHGFRKVQIEINQI
jgi:hypothetical protein